MVDVTAPPEMQMSAIVREKRIGEFVIDEKAVLYRCDALFEVFKHMVVVRCELQHLDGAFHYTAYSPLFEPIEEGHAPPYYVITISGTTGEIMVQNEEDREKTLLELSDEAKKAVEMIMNKKENGDGDPNTDQGG